MRFVSVKSVHLLNVALWVLLIPKATPLRDVRPIASPQGFDLPLMNRLRAFARRFHGFQTRGWHIRGLTGSAASPKS
jgi:hypothetical protein